MRIRSARVPGSTQVVRLGIDLSEDAYRRLKWFDYYRVNGNNARLTCRHFGISPQTFYRWKRRYNPGQVDSLEDHSHRPRHLRQPTASAELIKAICALREEWPRWGKEKIAVLLRQRGWEVSSSMVGRVIRRLKDRGLLKEPIANYVSAGKRRKARPYAQRKPSNYRATDIGELVELDTLDIRPLPGVGFKHLTAHDVVSRWNVIGIYNRATAKYRPFPE